MSPVPVRVIRERRIAEAFEDVGATTPAAARAPAEIGVDAEGAPFRRLRARGIVREGAPGRYFLDVASWRLFRRGRRRAALLAVFAALAASAVTIAHATR